MEEMDSVHQLCVDGDWKELRNVLERRKGQLDVNVYRLLVYRPLPSKCKEMSGLVDDAEDEEEYQSDENGSEQGLMFDYRSPLFDAVLHNQLQCVQLLIEHGANPMKLRFSLFLSFSLID